MNFEERNLKYAEICGEHIKERTEGKFIFAEAREDNATRLFIHQLDEFADVLGKKGWWDTFTISEKSCKKGIHLCKVMKVTTDKEGYLMLIVSPYKFLGETIDETSPAWDYFFLADIFAKDYVSNEHAFHWNEEAIVKKFESLFEEKKSLQKEQTFFGQFFRATVLFEEWLNDNITLDDIANALNEKLPMEVLAEDLFKNRKIWEQSHPRLVSKLPIKDGFLRLSDIENFLQRKQWEYEDLLKEGVVNPKEHLFDQIEEICIFREKEKEMKKAAKKAARLAKKNKE